MDTPQTWNLYAGVYPERSRRVADNPTTDTDPTGLSSQYNTNGGCATLRNCTDDRQSLDHPPGQELNSGTSTNQANMLTATVQGQGNDPTLNLGGTKVNVTLTPAMVDGRNSVVMKADPQGCSNCGWAQTVSQKGAFSTAAHTDREVGGQPLYPASYPLNELWDAPGVAAGNAATFRAVSSLGVANGKTFEVRGSMTWGYSVDKSGHISPYGPRVATPDEERKSIQILRRDSPSWTITGP